jgi:signal transduction histidine kinase/response regulator RpfG family c-di-GMP phosphodiesterase/HAMP domain-containing protein
MKLKDMQIGTQLRLGLGLMLTFVLFLGGLAWLKTDIIWMQTKTMYDHPLQVRRAIDHLELAVESLSRHARDLFLAQNKQETETSLQNIEIDKSNADRQIAILYDKYLGPRDDIVILQNELVKWDVLRDETIRLLVMGKKTEAEARIRTGGVQDIQAQVVRSHFRKIDDFVRIKSDQLYQASTLHKVALNRQIVVIVSAILLSSLIIFWYLLKAIKDPLGQLTTAAEQFRQGKMDVRSGYVSANEFGVLSNAFNTMAETVETQMLVNEQAAQLSCVMLRETEMHAFCRELLKELLNHTGSQLGAIYLLNAQKTEFEHFESIGLGTFGRASFSAVAPEGEFGTAIITGRVQRVTDIPNDTRFTFATVSSEFKPREIITIPLLSDHQIAAVLSLASVRDYDKNAILLLEGVLDTVAARMNGMLAYRQTQELAERLDHQNRELEAQKMELAAQADELVEHNTELELQKKQLDEANRLKSAFLSNMSHELRTPLNSVIALSGVLNRRLAGTIPEDEYGYLEVIERNGRQLLALINDILDLSRIEAGREEINLGQFSIRALAGDVVTMIEPQAREKGIALLNQVGDGLPRVISDPLKCRHILQNLVGNAVKFTETGSVEILARQVGDELHVAVSDTGIGIAANQLSHIFEEFRQADDTTTRKYGGTGLGLAIARKYATLLHGSITVESTPGQGSTFTLRLPFTISLPGTGVDAETATGNLSGTSAGGQWAVTGNGKCILLVEDSEPAVIQMTDFLAGQGYEVRMARNGREALEYIEKSLPDAMILDLMMPEIDGFEVLRQIRSSENTTLLPVLILTAKHVSREELSFLKGNHIYQLIQKGDVSRAELLAAVAKMITPTMEESAPRTRPRVREPRQGMDVILVVEDNPDNMLTMRALLQNTCTLLEAADGLAGVELARRHVPDLILMDIALPVMDGFAALAAIRDDEALRDIPVVAVTASAMTGNREEILAHGFDGYISKPIDEELLRKTLSEVLNGNG